MYKHSRLCHYGRYSVGANDIRRQIMTHRDPIIRWSTVFLVCGAIGLSGCSAGKPPTAQLAQATLAVQEADKSKAPQYAPAELHTARQELERAQQAMREKDYT